MWSRLTEYSGLAWGMRSSRSSSAVHLGLDIRGHAGALGAFAEVLGLGLAAVRLAEFLLDGLELLLEEVLALGLFDLAAGLVLDLLGHLQNVDPLDEAVVDLLEPLEDVGGLEQVLALLDGVGEVGGDEVGQGGGVVDAVEHADGLVGDVGAQFDDPLAAGTDAVDHGLELGWCRWFPGE